MKGAWKQKHKTSLYKMLVSYNFSVSGDCVYAWGVRVVLSRPIITLLYDTVQPSTIAIAIPSLVPSLPDFFNVHEKRGGAWYIKSRERRMPIYKGRKRGGS